ncbi:MAG TPA: amidohydrolase family protein [Prolixibacteraceae bacterium]|nr:amidohydrolase family protein [Prolixibacteraceae bacterium]
MKNYSVEGIDYRTKKAIRIEIEDGRIVHISECDSELSSYLAPGLVDLQINGYKGIDLNQSGLSVADIDSITRMLWEQGVTTFFPTIISNSDEETESLLGTISLACSSVPEVEASIGGIHLEGPFISPEDGPRGAHSKLYIKAPDWDLFARWQEASGGRIRIITLSPEWPGSTDFIRRCTSSGVVVSIGHTAATPDQIRKAVDSGASMSTHLGNGSHLMLPRHPNYIWEQLASENLWSGIIADGFHLPDSVLKVFLKVKPEKTILVSDVTSFAGLSPGVYTGHIGGEVELSKEGRLFVKGNPQFLAGSAQTLLWCVNQLIKKDILPLKEAWNMASLKPVEFLNMASADAFQIGVPADLVIFKKDDMGIEILKTIKTGKTVFSKN